MQIVKRTNKEIAEAFKHCYCNEEGYWNASGGRIGGVPTNNAQDNYQALLDLPEDCPMEDVMHAMEPFSKRFLLDSCHECARVPRTLVYLDAGYSEDDDEIVAPYCLDCLKKAVALAGEA